MSLYAVHNVCPRGMVTIARFLSWLPNLRPGLARLAVLDGAAGQACLDDLRSAPGVTGTPYFLVGPVAATAIIEAYRAGALPLKDGARIGKTARAEVYARSPLLPPRYL